MIGLLQASDVNRYSAFVINVINSVPYYSDRAKQFEVEGYDPLTVMEQLKDKKHIHIVAKNKSIWGFLHGHYDCGTFWINWIGVSRVCRRKKIATKLMEFLIEELSHEEVHKIWWDTRTNNKEAIQFFSDYGLITTRLNNHWYNSDFYIWEMNI